MSNLFFISSFYHFFELRAESVPEALNDIRGAAQSLRGLIILATEGVNGTVSGSEAEVLLFCTKLKEKFGIPEVNFKNSTSQSEPFKRLKLEIREEIVESGHPELKPLGKRRHLSPTEWNRTLEQDDVLLLDTRNIYETEVGSFRGAIDPRIEKFNQFPDFVKNSNLPRDKKILMYCTGGIRCEKAILEMERQGYSNVYQLHGGILKYMEEYPNSHFEGECFVFDRRVSLDQKLEPTQSYKLCPHCGDPAKSSIECVQCWNSAVVCESCLREKRHETCSKNCAHHFDIGTRPKRIKRRINQGELTVGNNKKIG